MPFQTPNFASAAMNGWSCPRDVLTVVGPEIIEAATPWRSRNFEVHAYRDILMDYFTSDPQMCPPRATAERTVTINDPRRDASGP